MHVVLILSNADTDMVTLLQYVGCTAKERANEEWGSPDHGHWNHITYHIFFGIFEFFLVVFEVTNINVLFPGFRWWWC